MQTLDLGTQHLVCTVEDRVMRVRLDRLERKNACTQAMYRGLKRAAILADGDPELDLVVLTGTGDWFGSGGDMSGDSEDPEGLAQELDPTDHFPFRHFERCRKVLLAAVNGGCHAGALNLVMYCDLAIASSQAHFRVPELLRGAPDPFMAARLAEYVGIGVARYLFFTAQRFDAQEALAMGLIGRVVPHADFEAEVERAIEQIKKTGPRSRAMVKDDINARLPSPDFNMFKRAIMSPEMIEGMKAFLERRDPNWPR